MKFLVVVPTIRQNLPGFEPTLARLRASFTHPTELHILDGSRSKPAALNQAFDDLLAPSDCDVYVTVDDDYLAAPGWQDAVAKAMEALPWMGACGIWLGEAPEMQDYMGAHMCGPVREENGIRFRPIHKTHHIAGALIAFRREVAVAVGKQPHSDLGYQIWEDAYRGRRVRVVGKELVYLVLDGELPGFHTYDDTPAYRAQKQEEMEKGRPMAEAFLAMGGIRDPLSLRLRRFLGRRKQALLASLGRSAGTDPNRSE